MKRNIFILVLVLLSLSLGEALIATNGYFSHGYGAKSKGMAGAGTALSLSTLDSVTNPAAMVFLGKRFDIGVAFFMPQREYTVNGAPSMFPGTFPLTPGTVESDSTLFVIPHLGANFMRDENTSLGITLYGNGGMNTDYPTSTFHGTSPTGVNLAQLIMAPTLSMKVTENHAIGASVLIGYQRFRAYGMGVFTGFSDDPNRLTNRGDDQAWGGGLRLGWTGKVTSDLTVGLTGATRVYMQEFDKYAGLFAEQGAMDVPANYGIGVAWNATSNSRVGFLTQGRCARWRVLPRPSCRARGKALDSW